MTEQDQTGKQPGTGNYERIIGATDGWEVGLDASEPLPEFIQEYARDVVTWFNPAQGWHITDVRAGLLDPAQVRYAAEQRTDAPTELSPDILTLGFTLKAANPPTRKNLRRHPVALDMRKAISPDFDGRVIFDDLEDRNSAKLFPKKIGTSYPLEEALRELSNTFYLSGVLVDAAYEHPVGSLMSPYTTGEATMEPFPRNISIMVILRNLYTKLEQEEVALRTQREEMARKLGIEIAEPTSVDPRSELAPANDTVEKTEEKHTTKDKKDTPAEASEDEKTYLEPGVYRFTLKDNLWYRDIQAGITKLDEPPVSFSDIGGLSEIKDGLRLLVAGLHNPELFAKWGTRPPRGILLYGPPGTGKTMTAKALAHEAGIPFFSLQFTDVASRWVHHSTENVKRLLEALDTIKGKKIVFVDEFDNVAPSRDAMPETQTGGSARAAREILNPLLEYMDGFRSTNDTIFVAATNRKDDIDEAMLRPGRFDRQYHIRPPQGNELVDVYRVQVARAQKEAGRNLFVAEIDFDTLMRSSKGFTGADVAEVIRRVLENKVKGELEGKEQTAVTTEDLHAVVNTYERKRNSSQIGFITQRDK